MFVRPLRSISSSLGSVQGSTTRTKLANPRPRAISYYHRYSNGRHYVRSLGRVSQSSEHPNGSLGLNGRTHFHTTPTACKQETFKLADIGEGITECEVIKWTVKEGTKVTAFDPLCEVQSDKASVEITSPFDGVVKQLLVKEGDIAKVGSGLCVIEVDAEEGAVAEPQAETAQEPKQQQQQEKAPEQPSQPQPQPQPTRRKHPLDPTYVAPSPSEASPTTTARTGSRNQDVLAAPSTRHFARSQGIDLGLLVGSGRNGRVEIKDVQNWIASGAAGVAEDPQVRKEPVGAQEEDVVVELGRIRYGMWKAMVKSLEIPHFGYTTTLDITSLHQMLPVLSTHIPSHFLPTSTDADSSLSSMVNPSALYPSPNTREKVPENERYSKLTYLPVLLKTLSKAMLEWPLLRATITPGTAETAHQKQPTLTIRPHADISVALSTRTGLYTPTLSSVDTSSIYTIASRLKRLSALGRKVPSGLTIADMPKRGGTITVSNVGAVGNCDSAHPVLVPGGGVAIVALGRAKWVWDVGPEFWEGKEGNLVTDDYTDEPIGHFGRKLGKRRLKLGVSWSADHRVVEGAELAAFVESWRGWVENPERLIGDAGAEKIN